MYCKANALFSELKQLNLSQLNEVYLELELLIREYSETLISELALRDELEYEKELKNTFISLLLSVQNRRRQEHVRGRQQGANGAPRGPPPSKFLTTVIPYHMEMGTPDNHALQVLIKSKLLYILNFSFIIYVYLLFSSQSHQ